MSSQPERLQELAHRLGGSLGAAGLLLELAEAEVQTAAELELVRAALAAVRESSEAATELQQELMPERER